MMAIAHKILHLLLFISILFFFVACGNNQSDLSIDGNGTNDLSANSGIPCKEYINGLAYKRILEISKYPFDKK